MRSYQLNRLVIHKLLDSIRMPFETFAVELTCFLSLITILVSHPTEPYYIHAWQRPDTYKLVRRQFNQGPVRRHDIRIELPVLDPRNITQSKSDIKSTQSQNSDEKSTQVRVRNTSLQPGPEYRQTNLPQNTHSLSTAYTLGGEESLVTNVYGSTNVNGIKNFNGSYSSQVTEGGENQNDWKSMESSKSPGNAESGKKSIGRGAINFEENLRNFQKSGSTRKGTNAISTTEKIVRTQTQKGNKRPSRPNSPLKPLGSQIVFPDGLHLQKFTPVATKCGKGTTFCENVGEEYPADYINQILKKEGSVFRGFFGKDEIRDPNITERINVPEENSMCPFREEIIYPKAAKNKEDKWLFVINQDQYIQGVKVEVCLNPDSSCMLTDGFPLGYVTFCKQKYIERRLVAIGEDGRPQTDSFRLPACCSCVFKYEPSARFGPLMTPRNTKPKTNF